MYKDIDGNTCALCTCGQEIYLAEVPGSKVWVHSDNGSRYCNPHSNPGTLAAPDARVAS